MNRDLLPTLLLPLGITLGVGALAIFYLWYTDRKKPEIQAEEITLSSPFQFFPALKFGLFYIAILVLAKVINTHFGAEGIYLTSVIAGLADVDAITVSMAQLTKSNEVSFILATRAITIAVLVNTLVKLVIAHLFGGKAFARKLTIIFGIVFLSGLAATILL